MSVRELLQEIPGIGPETADRYIDLVPHRTKTIKQLRYALIRLPNDVFTKRLPVLAQADILFQPLRRISRDLIKIVEEEFKRTNKGIRFDIAGSYRRGKPTSGDLDIVVSARSTDKRDTWERFTKNNNKKSRRVRIMNPIAGHDDKITVLFRICIPARIDITNFLEPYHNKSKIQKNRYAYIKADVFLTRPEEYVFALLFVTGSGRFNVLMRRQAKLRGYKLNQYGLFQISNGKSVHVKNEKDLFKLLGMRYRQPHERT